MGRMRCASFLVALLTMACSTPQPSSSPAVDQQPRWGLVIHTGAGNFSLESLSDRREPMRVAMTEALTAGHRILAEGGASLDAIEAAIVILEDSPLFNAGKEQSSRTKVQTSSMRRSWRVRRDGQARSRV